MQYPPPTTTLPQSPAAVLFRAPLVRATTHQTSGRNQWGRHARRTEQRDTPSHISVLHWVRRGRTPQCLVWRFVICCSLSLWCPMSPSATEPSPAWPLVLLGRQPLRFRLALHPAAVRTPRSIGVWKRTRTLWQRRASHSAHMTFGDAVGWQDS